MAVTKDTRIAKFTNYLMKEGKKNLALNLLEETFAIIKKKGNKNPEELFHLAVENIMPRIEVRPKRVGGSIYQVPQEVRPNRQFALASRWILDAARNKKGSSFPTFLAQELMEASQESGTAYKKKLDVYKMADANKAFARFANFGKRG